MPEAVDLVIEGGIVHDGSGRPGYRADVAVSNGRIVAVAAEGRDVPARRRLRADDLIVAPGFIDLHSHADFTLPAYPGALNSISQGVTSEVVGNCGYSPAPLSADPGTAAEQIATFRALGPDLDWEWRGFGEFLDRLDAARPAVNCVPLIGHGAVRMAALGFDDRPPTTAEARQMHDAVADGLAAGAWGMSTGLVYPPASFASTDEVVEVGASLPHARSLYASHIRNEGAGLLEAIDEALTIGRRLRTAVHVSHLKSAGRQSHGKIGAAVDRLTEARRRGARVTCDAYPYTAGSTMLSQLLPPWVHDGGIEAMFGRLGSDLPRDQIRVDVATGLPGWSNYVEAAGGFEQIRIASVGDRRLAGIEGHSVAELANRDHVDPLTFVFDLLVRDRAATVMIVELMHEDDVTAALRFPATGIGSDQLAVTGPDASVHPRCYGTFAKVLGTYVRERGVLAMAEAIHRMTGLAAEIIGLTDRGRVVPGAVADLVVFDPATIRDQATYGSPTQLAAGVEAVLVDGRFAWDGGRPADLHLGRVLRREAQ